MAAYKRTRIVLAFTGFILLFSFNGIGVAEEAQQNIQQDSKQEEKKAPRSSCLTSDGAVIQMTDTAFMRINYQNQFVGAWRDTGSGPDGTKPTTDFYFRRNRLTVSGQASKIVGYDIKIEQMGPRRMGALSVADEPVEEFEVLEASVDAEFSKAFHLTVGKTKIPFTREVLEGCFSPLSADRSLFIATPMQTTRDQGIVFWGNLINSKVGYMAAIQEGQESGLAPESSPRYTGRVHLALLDPEEGYGYQGSYLGNKMVFTIGAAAQYESGAVYSDYINETGDKNYSAWTADVFLEYPIGDSGSLNLSGAYMETNFDEAYQGANPDPGSIEMNGQKKGWYAKAGYLFINKIGPGQIQPFARYEEWEFAQLNSVFAQQIKWTGIGLNYLINGQNLRLTVEYAKTDFKDETNDEDFSTVTTMFQFGF